MKIRLNIVAAAVLILLMSGCNTNAIGEASESQHSPPASAAAQESSDTQAGMPSVSASYPEQAAEYLRQSLDGSTRVFINRAKDMGVKHYPGVNYSDARMSPDGNNLLCKTDAYGAGEARWSGYSVISLTTNPTEVYAFDGMQWGDQDHVFLSSEIIGFASGSVIGGQEDTWESIRLFDNQYNPLDTRLAFPEREDTQIVGIGYDAGKAQYVLAYAVNAADGQELSFSRNRLGLALFGSDGALMAEHVLAEDYMSLFSPNLLSLIPSNPVVTSDGRILISAVRQEDAEERKLLVINTADWSLQELPYGEAIRLSANGDRAFAISYDGQAVPSPVILDFKDGAEVAVTALPDTLWEVAGYANRFYPIDAVMRDHHVYIMAESHTEDNELLSGLFYWDGEQAELLQIFPGRGFSSLAGVDNEGFCYVMLHGIYGEDYADQQDYAKALIEPLAAKPEPDGERLYTIPLGNRWDSAESWIIDKDGKGSIVKNEAAPDYTEVDLADLATGEVRYRYRMRDEIVRDELGYPQTNRMCALYDLNGNMLIDWENKDYRDAFGEYIIRQDSTRGIVAAEDITDGFRTALYHVPTGTERYEGAHSAVNLEDGNVLLLDSQNTTLAVVDPAGGAVSEFPMSKPYYSAYMRNGFLTASSQNSYEQTKESRRRDYLLEFRDGSLQEIFSAEWLSELYGSLQGNYLTYHNGADWGIYQRGKGVVFETDGASIEYYDGALAIVQTGSYRGGEPVKAALVTSEYKELAGGFSWLRPVQASYFYEDKTPAEKFAGILGGKAVLLDRSGNVLAESPELPDMATAPTKSVNTLCDGLYTYYVETGTSYGHGLLGPELQVLIPVGRYTYIDPEPVYAVKGGEWDGRAENTLLRANKEIGISNEPGRMIYLMDVLDHTGKVIADNVSDVYDVGPDRIALRRGFDIGLMDFDGNWIVKRKIFTGFNDD